MERPKSRNTLTASPNHHNSTTTPLLPKNKSILLFMFISLLAALATLKLGIHLDAPRCSTQQPEFLPAFIGPSSTNGTEEGGIGEEERLDEFWEQPDGMGYRPCLRFSKKYVSETKAILENRTKFLVVVVSGGLNQQRSQTIDAVVIARILGAALVVPIFSVNPVWGDESEFSDIFDLEHFKRVLADDVRVVSSLPPSYLRTVRPVEESKTPFAVSAGWIRHNYLKLIEENFVLLMKGLDSRLSKDLPADLQRLRCKVAFQALRFTPRILELGNRLAGRLRRDGPYLALHLRMEKDVWVRTGCLPGLTPEHDAIIQQERDQHPELLTARTNMSYAERKLAGLCPLTMVEVTRLLKALGCPRDARIYWAGGEPFGGRGVVENLAREFPYVFDKENVSLPGELEEFVKRPMVLAAIDFVVAEMSDVFMQSHGGNMGRFLQGYRAYNGHKKHIVPNKRDIMPYFLNTSLNELEFNRIVKDLHNESLGQPHVRLAGKDITAHPIPICMCNTTHTHK